MTSFSELMKRSENSRSYKRQLVIFARQTIHNLQLLPSGWRYSRSDRPVFRHGVNCEPLLAFKSGTVVSMHPDASWCHLESIQAGNPHLCASDLLSPKRYHTYVFFCTTHLVSCYERPFSRTCSWMVICSVCNSETGSMQHSSKHNSTVFRCLKRVC